MDNIEKNFYNQLNVNCYYVENLSQLSIIHHFLPYLLASKSRPPPPWDQKPYMYKIQCTTRGDNSGLHMPKLPNTNLWLCGHVMADLVSEGAVWGVWGGRGRRLSCMRLWLCSDTVLCNPTRLQCCSCGGGCLFLPQSTAFIDSAAEVLVVCPHSC